MEKTLTLSGTKELKIGHFDKDNEIEICMTISEYDYSTWISPNQVNELITHLVDQLKYIDYPIDVLTQFQPRKNKE